MSYHVGLNKTRTLGNRRLRPLGGSWSMFSRMRILAGGQSLDGMDMYSRVHELYNVITTADCRINEFAEGFADVWESSSPPTPSESNYRCFTNDSNTIITDCSVQTIERYSQSTGVSSNPVYAYRN